MAGFSDLPIEVRLTIWLLIIPDDEEGVCLIWPGHSPGSVGEGQPPLAYLPVLPLTVDTGFPLAMHICRESRAVALNPKAGGVRLRASHVARCMTPFRCFRPELDVLYLDQESIFHLDLLSEPGRSHLPLAGPPETPARLCFEVFMDILRRTRRFAVPVALALDDVFLFLVSDYLRYHSKTPAPASLCIVLPYTTPYVWRDNDNEGPGLFVPPGKRCRLVTVPPAALQDDALVVVAQGGGLCRVMTARQAVADVYGLVVKEREETEPWEELGMRDGLELQVRVFVEHQGNGTWCEACRDRMYKGGYHSSSRIDVPLSRRPNPELVRVHDTDAVFRPVDIDWKKKRMRLGSRTAQRLPGRGERGLRRI
ncbi:uncharacterized protein LMH87_008995 [Akanthomyces muscarius]|uniref:2EXR domain-containing protein n=1 Tax=Akanthomyces muscarius TaxID=2231603 RepID=A0A9W8QIC1_AKAMU|nr:uncharacterized protein LMH87_008995 [Akanthomyces muscarius]KAJ4158471.1 hypothetical protein LMH87_008995 [Akanthomyces muscarius]